MRARKADQTVAKGSQEGKAVFSCHREGPILAGPVMTSNLTFDRRVIDGAPAAAFMIGFAQILEKPGLLLL